MTLSFTKKMKPYIRRKRASLWRCASNGDKEVKKYRDIVVLGLLSFSLSELKAHILACLFCHACIQGPLFSPGQMNRRRKRSR